MCDLVIIYACCTSWGWKGFLQSAGYNALRLVLMLDKYLKPLEGNCDIVVVCVTGLFELLFAIQNETMVLWFSDVASRVSAWPLFSQPQNFHTGVSWVYNSCSPHYFQVWSILQLQLRKLVFLNQAWKQFHCWCQVPPAVTCLLFPHLPSHLSVGSPWLVTLQFSVDGAVKTAYAGSVLKATCTGLFNFQSFLDLNHHAGRKLLPNCKLCMVNLSTTIISIYLKQRSCREALILDPHPWPFVCTCWDL